MLYLTIDILSIIISIIGEWKRPVEFTAGQLHFGLVVCQQKIWPVFSDKNINLHPWHPVEPIGVVVQRKHGLQRNSRQWHCEESCIGRFIIRSLIELTSIAGASHCEGVGVKSGPLWINLSHLVQFYLLLWPPNVCCGCQANKDPSSRGHLWILATCFAACYSGLLLPWNLIRFLLRMVPQMP